jgi:hypothetical protein
MFKITSPFSNFNGFKSSFPSKYPTTFDSSKFQAMHFTFGIAGGEER